jgi:U3 small nucleolar RNA-associated protein 5
MSTKRKPPVRLAQPVVKTSTKLPNKSIINESRTSVSAAVTVNSNSNSNIETVEISSDSGSSDDSEEEANSDAEMSNQIQDSLGQQLITDAAPAGSRLKHQVNGNNPTRLTSSNQIPREVEADAADSDVEITSPTFGELLQDIEVPASTSRITDHHKAVVLQTTGAMQAPPAVSSLTTVLTQALRTDDIELLESCLQKKDLGAIRNTIERLDSSLAGILLTKLAARIHRRPGRAGTLITWIQWTLVAHGGALATQKDMLAKLTDLQKVLAERSRGLSSLLSLKGKLDMLDAQMQLRKRPQGRNRRRRNTEDDDEDIEDDEDDVNDENVIVIEGEDDVDGALESSDSRRRQQHVQEDEDFDGALLAAAESPSEGSDEEEIDLQQQEADTSASEESLDEAEVDYDDIDESASEEDDSEADDVPPAKVQKVGGSFSRRR